MVPTSKHRFDGRIKTCVAKGKGGCVKRFCLDFEKTSWPIISVCLLHTPPNKASSRCSTFFPCVLLCTVIVLSFSLCSPSFPVLPVYGVLFLVFSSLCSLLSVFFCLCLSMALSLFCLERERESRGLKPSGSRKKQQEGPQEKKGRKENKFSQAKWKEERENFLLSYSTFISGRMLSNLLSSSSAE